MKIKAIEVVWDDGSRDVFTPAPRKAPITQADIKRAEEELKDRRARGELLPPKPL